MQANTIPLALTPPSWDFTIEPETLWHRDHPKKSPETRPLRQSTSSCRVSKPLPVSSPVSNWCALGDQFGHRNEGPVECPPSYSSGVIILQTMHWYKGNHQIPKHLHTVIPTKMGNLVTPVYWLPRYKRWTCKRVLREWVLAPVFTFARMSKYGQTMGRSGARMHLQDMWLQDATWCK